MVRHIWFEELAYNQGQNYGKIRKNLASRPLLSACVSNYRAISLYTIKITKRKSNESACKIVSRRNNLPVIRQDELRSCFPWNVAILD